MYVCKICQVLVPVYVGFVKMNPETSLSELKLLNNSLKFKIARP